MRQCRVHSGTDITRRTLAEITALGNYSPAQEKTKMINTSNDSVYNFLTNQICKADYEIRENKRKFAALSRQQSELKRGKAYLVQVRRDYVEGKEPKAKKRRENTVETRLNRPTTAVCNTAGH